MRIGVDLMGSDRSPAIWFQAALDLCVKEKEGLTLVLFGTAKAKEAIDRLGFFPSWFEWVEVGESIEMDDPPLWAVRRKRASSMLVALDWVKKRKIDGLVSAGNTGALIAGSSLLLEPLGIERPALLATLPTVEGSVAVVDIGGNVLCRPKHLVQYARIGSIYQACSESIHRPKVGLLNIGSEARKGTRIVREAYEVLLSAQEEAFEFVGNIEGREAFSGIVDVLVTEGFTGNIFLKTAEGISSFILEYLYRAFGLPRGAVSGGAAQGGDAGEKVQKEEIQTVLQQLNRRVNYAEYPGAIVCGVKGVVAKCHGSSCQQAMTNGIKGVMRLVQEGLIEKMEQSLLGRKGCC